MPSIERDASRDSTDRHLKHQHSTSSDSGRAIVPMWDSSDPDRAPPPLPMNPSSPIVSTSRPNTSSAIQSAHAALTEKARENGYMTNAPPPKRIESPERSLIKGAAHKRMQSLHTGSVRDLSSFLESGSSFGSVKSPEKTYGRPSTPHTNKDFVLESRSPEKESRFPIELKSHERDSRYLLESRSPEKELRFPIELKSPERDSRFLLESKSPDKESRFPIELKSPERDSRFLLEDKSSEKHARFSSENRSPERESRFLLEGLSPEKESRFSSIKPQERDLSRSGTPTPGRETPTRDMPTLRPSLRRPPQSILGENTPPQSATMLALQNMATKEDTTLSNVTNGSTALVRTPQTFDAISTQILNITSIATSLQREMAQLSRRSKDNATDLVSLKEATNARDEDIRKSLRELVASISESSSRASNTVYGSGGLFIDNKAHNSPSTSNRTSKQFTLPRIPSPSSFAASLDREVMISPAASYCHDGVTNIALLEKILREMSTREGQEQLAGRLLEVADRLARDGTATAKKLDELLELLKDHHSQALVAQSGGGSGGGAGSNKPRNFSFSSAPVLELDFDQSKSGSMTQRAGALLSKKENIGPPATRATEIINEDVVKLIRTIKDSVSQGGGLTAEVKALVRELRGEVLGMGREIGRKLEEADTASAKDNAEERDRVTRVVQDGLDDLKEHMDSILREHRRQSSASIASNRVDYQEIYKAVRIAVNEKQQRSPELQKEDIVQAVKEAWENYKPDIELQQFGLEREELLTCLKEGIQEFCPEPSAPGATRDEVFTAVVEGLKHFVPPQVETQASLSRDEILDAVRECLEEFEFPSAPPAEPLESGITRDDMLDAVNQGLQAFDFAASTTALSRGVDVNLTRDDMLDAVKEGLHTFDFPINAPANGQDIDQVFSKDVVVEAVKEGLQSFDFAATTNALSRDIGEPLTRHDVVDAVQEGLLTFDFAATTTALSRDVGEPLTRHDVLDAVQEGLHTFEFPATNTDTSRTLGDDLTRNVVLDAINEGLNNFDFAATTTALTRNIGGSVTRDDVLDAVKEGLHSFDFGGTTSNALTRDIGNGLSKEDVYEAVKAGLDDVPQMDGFGGQIFEKLQEIVESMRVEFQAVSDEAKQNVSASGRDTEQVLDATKDGFEKLRGDIETYVDRALEINGKDELLDRLRDSFDNLRTEVELLSSQGSSSSLDAVQSELEHLREAMATSLVRGSSSADKDEILDAIRTSMNSIKAEIEQPRSLTQGDLSTDKDEILEVLRTGLDNIRTELAQPQALVRADFSADKDEILDAIKAGTNSRGDLSADKDEILEALRIGLDNIRTELEQPQALVRGDIGADKDEILDAIRAGTNSRSDISADKDEILEALRTGLDNIRNELGQPQALVRGDFSADKDEILDAIRADTNSRGHLSADKDEILEVLRTSLENIRIELEQPQALVRSDLGSYKEEILDAIRASTNSIKTEIEQPDPVTRSDLSANKDEILEALRTGLDNIRIEPEQTQALVRGDLGTDKDEVLEVLRTGLDNIRNELEQPQELVRGDLGAHKDEILEALKNGLDSLRMDLDRNRDASESVLSGSGEVLGALHDGLNSLRTDLEKIVNKPVDMTVNYEILDTLKLGLEGLRADIDRLRENGHGEQALANINDGAVVTADSLKRNDIENLEVLITQLRTKVEAFEPIPPPPPQPAPGSLSKSDLDAVEDMLRSVQESIATLSTKERSVDEDGVKRDDVISIETLLRNTKAKIDEIDPEQAVRKDHLDAVEILVSETQTSIKEMTSHLDDVSKRDDVLVVEGLVRDVMGSLEDMKERAAEEAQGADKPTKTDIEAVEKVCQEVKAAIEQMIISDISILATKEDVKNLEGLVKEFRGRAEQQEVAIYKGFEERQAETVGVGERVSEVKSFLEEFRDALKEKLDSGASSVRSVAALVESIGEKVESNSADVADDVKEMFEVMKSEFEKSNAGVVGSKLESDEKFQQTWDRFDSRLEEKFDELMTKYDDAQLSAETKATMEDEKKRDIEVALLGTKAVAEDVKLLIDTLGTTLTESVEKMDESGKTVFSRVEDTFTRVEETHADAKAEHQLTREQVFKTIGGIEGVQSYLTEYNPKILESVKDVLLIVGQHYEHSKTSTMAIQKIAERPPPPELPLICEAPPPVEKYDDTGVHEKLDKLVDHMHDTDAHEKLDKLVDHIHDTDVHEKLDKLVDHVNDTGVHEKLDKLVDHIHDTEVHEKLDKLFDRIPDTDVHEKLDKLVDHIQDTEVHEKLDKLVDHIHDTDAHEKLDKLVDHIHDTDVHEKLDKLVDHVHVAGKSFAQLEMLDKIHQQVMQTAAEVSEFVSNQTQRIADDYENKEKAVEAATIALEKKLAQQEHVEANVVGLRNEEERLKESVVILRAEQEDLAHQKMRLSADVSSLETALRIRREELHAMEARAEGLERRILEGVIDHSRALLVSKSNKGRDAMSRKRVPSHAPSIAGSIISNATSKASTTHSAVSMAMNGNRGPTSVPISNSTGPSRRILSLNQITHNVPTGNFKRSHSVKTNTGAGVLRKSSWGGSLSHKYGDLNKENLALKESEEDEEDGRSDAEVSEAGTMRRSSHGTTIMTGTGTGVSESIIDEGTEWNGSSHSDDEDFSGDEEETQQEPSQMVLYEDGGQVV